MELKARLRSETWDDLVNEIYKMVFKNEKNE